MVKVPFSDVFEDISIILRPSKIAEASVWIFVTQFLLRCSSLGIFGD